MNRIVQVSLILSALLLVATDSSVTAQSGYTPVAQLCATTTNPNLCSVLPGNIGPDPSLGVFGYSGLLNRHPTRANDDVQTPFDNLSWQSFIALNWTAGQESQPPQVGLQSQGARVWQTWTRAGTAFHAPNPNYCAQQFGGQPADFTFASDGQGNEIAQHEEILQAATGDPAIDVNGNWTIYERRLNDVEIAYLQKPNGNPAWDLTTLNGQKAFIAASQTVNFPDYQTANAPTGAIEIKAAWRILDLKNNPADAQRFFVMHGARIAVAPDLVNRQGAAAPICAQVDLGLVAMHIIQKNVAQQNLKAQWFWSTFEHVDNAPQAAQPCDVTVPDQCTFGQESCEPPGIAGNQTNYSYFNTDVAMSPVNVAPVASAGDKFFWSPQQPYAAGYLVPLSGKMVGTQIARCWAIYETTASLNTSWQSALKSVNSVFANYMLVGTQWGTGYTADVTPKKSPTDAAPNMLANTLLETYIQTAYNPTDGFGTGSCISCHGVATFHKTNIATDLSFLPNLASVNLLRRAPLGQPAKPHLAPKGHLPKKGSGH